MQRLNVLEGVLFGLDLTQLVSLCSKGYSSLYGKACILQA